MGIILSIVSNIMYLSEKFTMCLAAASVLSCLILTFVMMLGMGVGLGYNYCFVEMKTKHRYVPGYYRYKVLEATTMYRTRPWRRIRPKPYVPFRGGMMSQRENTKQLIDYDPPTLNDVANMNSKEDSPIIEAETVEVTTKTSIESENTTATVNSTTTKTVIRIHGLDLIALLSKLNAENINYTLQIVTT